ncbi:hypothetical protein BGZ88_008925, partial [Linnemannia elongata]
KLKAIVQLVGYSTDAPDVASSKDLDEYYRDYIVASNDYFGNQFRYSVWLATTTFSTLSLPANKNSMSLVPSTVNAAYNPSSNSINVPAGILQLPFFNIENPEYINYGSMGVISGHEIGHAFDNSGRHYDSIGRVTNWWTNSTSKAFDEKAQCFVNQIKNFKLPGLDAYTPEQLFFIAYGRQWCNKMRPAALLNQMMADIHSPAKWRINGVAQNSPDFAKAFKCKTGAPMNPVKKCEVW